MPECEKESLFGQCTSIGKLSLQARIEVAIHEYRTAGMQAVPSKSLILSCTKFQLVSSFRARSCCDELFSVTSAACGE